MKSETKMRHIINHSLDDPLELPKEKKMFILKQNTPYLDYIPPRLTQGKVWYVSYSCIDPSTQKKKRVRIRVNRAKTLKERKLLAHRIIVDLTNRLSNGWNPFIEIAAPKGFTCFFEVLDVFLSIKKKECESNSMRSYISYVYILKKWLEDNKIKEMYVCNFSAVLASEFMQKANERISPRTYNNYLQFYKGLFNWMIEHNYISTNPFSKLKPKHKKLIKKSRTTLTKEDRKELQDFLLIKNEEYYVMCLLCYYCFLRPKEIALLRIGDFNLEQQTIFVRGEIAKNDTDSIRTIPDEMMRYILELDWDNPPSYYLFADSADYRFIPGTKAMDGRKISRYWSDYIRPALNFPMNLKFYSLKDTGITNMIDSGVPISFVQAQADHSSIAMTAIYTEKNSKKAEEQIKKVKIF